MELVHATPCLTYAAAARMVELAIAHARENGWNVAVVVVDTGGHLVAGGRMDGVRAAIFDIALDKGYTATLGKTSKAFGTRMTSAPDLSLGLSNRPRLCAWEGGVPVVLDGVLVGGMAVSGAAGHEDAACCRTALAEMGFDAVGDGG